MSTILTANPGPAEVRVVVSTDNPAAHGIKLWRRMARPYDDQFDDYAQVRAWPFLSGGAWAHNDIDILFGLDLTYQAEVYDDRGVLLESSEIVGPVVVSNPNTILREALLPQSMMTVRLVGMKAGDSESSVRSEILRPVGRSAPVVITDVRGALTGSTTMLTLTNTEQRTMSRLLDTGGVLLFTGPWDIDITWPIYMAFGAVSISRVSGRLSQARLWNADWVQVDPPPVIQPIPARTWQDILDAGLTWQALRGSTWLDVLFPRAPEGASARVFGG